MLSVTSSEPSTATLSFTMLRAFVIILLPSCILGSTLLLDPLASLTNTSHSSQPRQPELSLMTSTSDIVVTILLTVISLVGIVGNGLVVWAFVGQVVQGIVSSLLILLLACIDLSICAIGIPSTVFLEIWNIDTVDWVCRAQMAFKGFIVPVSACIMVMIAVERFLVICFIPGIGFRQPYLGVSFTSIIFVGVALAVPMSLHIHAVDVAHDSDSLLDIDMVNGQPKLTYLNKHSPPIRSRCKKDDSFIDDTLYWHYQILLSVVFATLFIIITLIYGIIFFFVWRHESLMFERYGKTKYRGYLIRVHSCKKGGKNTHPLLNRHDAEPGTLSTKQSLSAPAFCDSGTQNMTRELLPCVCLCDGGTLCSCRDVRSSAAVNTPKTNPAVGGQQQRNEREQINSGCSTSVSSACIKSEKRAHTGRIASPQSCPDSFPRPTIARAHGNKGNDKQESRYGNYNCYINPALAATSMEHRRRPHVRTAQTFAFIAAAFILSYTPYLVVTTWPVARRPLDYTPISKTNWFGQIRRILFYLYFVNSALNPIIYSCMNRHFQSRLSRLLPACGEQRKGSHEIVEVSQDEAQVVVSKPLQTTFEPTNSDRKSSKALENV